jgi:hypothetical protein
VAKVKRNVGKADAKPAATRIKGSRLGPFLEDWGRLVVPIVVFGALWILNKFGILSDAQVGWFLGILLLLGTFGAVVWFLIQNAFPRWVLASTAVVGVLYLAGTVAPFTLQIFPGDPDFDQTMTKEQGALPLGGVEGEHMVSVSVPDSEMSRNSSQAQYGLDVGGSAVTGKFSHGWQTVRGRKNMSSQVETTHMTEVHWLSIPPGGTVQVKRLDPSFGNEIRVRTFSRLMPGWVVYLPAALALLLGIFLDGSFQEQTDRWRIAPFFGCGLAFLVLFHADFNPDEVTRQVLGAAIVGGIVGFLVGWLLSLIGRKIIGTLRTKV